jgi:hypothetical protein
MAGLDAVFYWTFLHLIGRAGTRGRLRPIEGDVVRHLSPGTVLSFTFPVQLSAAEFSDATLPAGRVPVYLRNAGETDLVVDNLSFTNGCFGCGPGATGGAGRAESARATSPRTRPRAASALETTLVA